MPSTLSGDVRAATRSLRSAKWTSAAIVLMLAVGIGVATGAYAVFDFLFFRPVPGVAQPKTLVTIHLQPEHDPLSIGYGPIEALPHFRAVPSLERVAEWRPPRELPVATSRAADAAMVPIEFVSSDYFETLGVRAAAGRLLTASELATPGAHVVVISERLWRTRLLAHDAAVGATLFVNGLPLTIVGVVAEYEGWGRTRIGLSDAWVPAHLLGTIPGTLRERSMSTLVARVRGAVTVGVIQEQLRRAYARMPPPAGRAGTFVPTVYPGLSAFQSTVFDQRVSRLLPFVYGATSLLLLLACANAASLLLARMRQRQAEIAIRHAMGAGRWAVIRLIGVETTVLAIAACIGGVALASALMWSLRGLQLFSWTPALPAMPLDVRVVTFAVSAAALTLLVCGVGPALAACRVDVRSLLHEATERATGRRLLHTGLAAAQIAISVLLLAGAGVAIRSLTFLRSTDLGLDPVGVAALRVDPARGGYDTAAGQVLVQQVLQAAKQSGAIAGYASPPVLSSRLLTETRSADAPVRADRMAVSPDYFAVLKIPVLSGRTFSDAEFRSADGATVAIVSESLARALFPAAAPSTVIGRHISLTVARADRKLEIVGVVGDTRSAPDILAPPRPAVYITGSSGLTFGVLYVRSHSAAADALALGRRALRDVAPGLPPTEAETLQQTIDRLLAEDVTLGSLLAILSVLAALLALGGVHAVCSYVLSDRVREFGIRVALGASRGALNREALQQTLVTLVIGIPTGLGLYALASRLLSSRIHGVSPVDPATLAIVSLSLGAAALLAAWPPARRAARIDPVEALRER